MNVITTTVVLAACVSLAAQEQTPKPPSDPAAAVVEAPPGSTWSEGFGRATNYRTAFANAIEEAVGKVKGIDVARGPAWRSRLSVVSDHKEGGQEGWFNGEADRESEWVQQQIAGFVLRYEVARKEKAADGHWEVTVKALVASKDETDTTIVIELQDSDLRKWQLRRSEEDAPGRAIEVQSGAYEGPKLAEHLRNTGIVKIVAKGSGVAVTGSSARREREKAGHQLVASYRVVVDWQPIVLQSLIERPNKARPTAGPRPEYLSAGFVQGNIKIEDLVHGTELLELPFSVPADIAKGDSIERRDGIVNALVDKAKAFVAEAVFFKLVPPVVLRKWQLEEGKQWFIEVRLSSRVATAYADFAVGNNGSLASTDWQPLGRAVLLPQMAGGVASDICTFRLEGVEDPDRIEPNLTEVRPLKK